MYCTAAEVREVGTSITATAQPTEWTDTVLNKIIDRACRIFDRECGVPDGYFEAAPSDPAEITVYGDGTNYLKLPPYVAGTLNVSLTYPSGFSALGFVERGGYLVRTESGIINSFPSAGWYENVPIVVSARWGFATTPADVKHAIIEFAINLAKEIDPASIKMMNLDNQPLREKLPPRVQMIANKYKAKGSVMV